MSTRPKPKRAASRSKKGNPKPGKSRAKRNSAAPVTVKVVSRKLKKQTTRGASFRWYEITVSVTDPKAPLGVAFHTLEADAGLDGVKLPDTIEDESVRQGILSAVNEYRRRSR